MPISPAQEPPAQVQFEPKYSSQDLASAEFVIQDTTGKSFRVAFASSTSQTNNVTPTIEAELATKFLLTRLTNIFGSGYIRYYELVGLLNSLSPAQCYRLTEAFATASYDSLRSRLPTDNLGHPPATIADALRHHLLNSRVNDDDLPYTLTLLKGFDPARQLELYSQAMELKRTRLSDPLGPAKPDQHLLRLALAGLSADQLLQIKSYSKKSGQRYFNLELAQTHRKELIAEYGEPNILSKTEIDQLHKIYQPLLTELRDLEDSKQRAREALRALSYPEVVVHSRRLAGNIPSDFSEVERSTALMIPELIMRFVDAHPDPDAEWNIRGTANEQAAYYTVADVDHMTFDGFVELEQARIVLERQLAHETMQTLGPRAEADSLAQMLWTVGIYCTQGKASDRFMGKAPSTWKEAKALEPTYEFSPWRLTIPAATSACWKQGRSPRQIFKSESFDAYQLVEELVLPGAVMYEDPPRGNERDRRYQQRQILLELKKRYLPERTQAEFIELWREISEETKAKESIEAKARRSIDNYGVSRGEKPRFVRSTVMIEIFNNKKSGRSG